MSTVSGFRIDEAELCQIEAGGDAAADQGVVPEWTGSLLGTRGHHRLRTYSRCDRTAALTAMVRDQGR